MQTTEQMTIEALVRFVDDIGARSIFDARDMRKQGDYTPLQERNAELYRGFLSDWSGDCRVRFRSALVEAGWTTKFYNAHYHWSLHSDAQLATIEYVEGDVYLTID